MLRNYIPVDHTIKKLHELTEHLVCEVWCKADENDFEDKLHKDFQPIVAAYDWLEKGISDIYAICKGISQEEKNLISEAFVNNNKIEELCEGNLSPIYLEDLPEFVKENIKPLLIRFYNELLDRTEVSHKYGTKKSYFDDLYIKNRFTTCPCCGYQLMKSNLNKGREAFDHYLPKKFYPFTSVNPQNLIPLCHECNSSYKGETDTILDGRKAFYPFSNNDTEISIEFQLSNNIDFESLKPEDVKIELTSPNQEKIKTWNEIFGIKERYFEKTEQTSFSFLNTLRKRYSKRRKENPEWTFEDTLNDIIDDYKDDLYSDMHFLRIPFMEAILRDKILAQSFNEVY